MTDIIYQRGAVREHAIWPAFQHNGPFGTMEAEERTILFGLYANSYLHGQNYLKEIETEDLARLVDQYTLNMAMLTNDEAQTVLDIAAKRYVEQITNQIHAANIVTRERKLDALDDEYDAKMEALSADYAALETMRLKVQLAWDQAAQKVKDLEMRTELEDVNYQMIDVDITEQQLRSARADLAVIEAGLKGLDIQLEITQTGIDISNAQLEVTETETRESQIDVDISEVDLGISQVAVDITETGVRKSETEMDGQKILSDISNVNTNIIEAGVRKSEIEMDGRKIQSDTVGVNTRITETEIDIAQAEIDGRRIQTNTAEAEVNKIEAGVTKTQVELDGEQIQLETAETGVRITETELAESQAEIDGKKIELDTSKVYLSKSEAALDVSEAEAKLTQYDAEIVKIKADTEKLKLVDSELTMTQADERITRDENDILLTEKAMLISDKALKETETTFREDQKTTQEELDGKILSNDQGKHDFDMDVSQKTTEMEDSINDKKIELLKGEKKTLITDIRTRKYQDAKDKLEIKEQQKKAQVIYSQAAIDAAQLLANAQLITTLSHSIGEGELPTPTQQTWSNITLT